VSTQIFAVRLRSPEVKPAVSVAAAE